HARPLEPGLIEQTRAKKKIRRRAEGGHATALGERGDLAVLQMNAMAEHRTGTGQPYSRVNVDIALRFGKERPDPRDFRLVLVRVGLDVELRKLARQGARCLELRLRRGHSEARRDRVIEPAAA